MELVFEQLEEKHRREVILIYNYYVKNGNSAFASKEVELSHFDKFLSVSNRYPAFAILDKSAEMVAGFTLLSSFNQFDTFSKTACFTIFLHPNYTKHGLGSKALELLENEGRKIGIKHMISDVSTDNKDSIRFHENHGFKKVGQLDNIGYKLGKEFGIIYYSKDIL